MSKLHFEYWTDIAYSQIVTECHYTLKCLPQDTDMQKVTELNVTIAPEHEYQKGTDPFGNRTLYGNLYHLHDRFSFHVEGIVETDLAISQAMPEDEFIGVYRYPNTLNRAGTGIKKYFDRLQVTNLGNLGAEVTDYDRSVYMMNALHRDFTYESGVTHVGTTAEEAWQLGKGVCQDYAHILIALCHLASIPARYVVGMMMGEGYSHAWVEILSKGYWYGLDPTNGGVVTPTYIKIAHGRHANDCMVNKGIVKGGGWQTQEIRVVVEEIE